MKPDAPILVKLREMILQGRLAPGERVAEAAIAEALGLSRTPVRQALPVLAEEGLLSPHGARGYAVRAFTLREIVEAVEARGVLEGVAARSIAERGAPRALLRALRECLDEGDRVLAGGAFGPTEQAAYAAMNGRFHGLIAGGCENRFVRETLARLDRVPFAAPSAIAFDRMDADQMRDDLRYAHRQHHAIVDAIAQDEGARAEALMREHVHVQKHSMNLDRDDAVFGPSHTPGQRAD